MQRRTFVTLAAGLPLLGQAGLGQAGLGQPGTAQIPVNVLHDKIRGGFLGQLLGDLNGLVHEMKYIADPGDVRQYTPALPDGVWTDDDTDIEWPYLLEIERSRNLLLSPPAIAALWTKHINRRIWCSHLYLRQLLDLGIEPPLTGSTVLNPWAAFNLSGQFVSETWGLISPGMPQTAARIGTHYTHVSVDGEAIQSSQMTAAMIASAFFTTDMQAILDAGAAALDPRSVMSRVVSDVRRWARDNPRDWRTTRRLTKEKYALYGGQDMRDRNGVWLNGASTISALLYGDGDFVQTLRSAFNFGWDADNNAAAAGAVLGILKGYRWLTTQGWNIQDRYRNTSRDGLPENETITTYGDRLIAVADLNIARRGGSRSASGYRIPIEKPANIEPLPDPAQQFTALRTQWKSAVEKGVISGETAQERARAAYLAICLGLAPALQQAHDAQWSQALAALRGYPRVLDVLFYEAPFPAGDRLREKAVAAGLVKPEGRHQTVIQNYDP